MGATQSTPTPPSGAEKNNKNSNGTYGVGMQGDAPSALPSAGPFGRPDDSLRGSRGVIGNRAVGGVGNQWAGSSGGFAAQQQAGTPRNRIELYPFSTEPQKGTASSGDLSYKIGHSVPTDDDLKDMVRDERYWAKDDATRNRWRDHVAGQFARAYGGKRPTVELYDGAQHAAPSSANGPASHNPEPQNPASHNPALRPSGEHSPQHLAEYPPGHPVHRYARQWAARQAERQLLQAERAQAGQGHVEPGQAERAQAERVRADTLEGGAGRDPLAAQGGVGLNIAAIKGRNAGPAAPTYPSANASGTPDGSTQAIQAGASDKREQTDYGQNDKVFQEALKALALHEGGYSNLQKDLGGATMAGLSSKAVKDLKKNKPEEWGDLPDDPREIPKEVRERIFYEEYYKLPQIDKLAAMPGLAEQEPRFITFLFDSSINHGVPDEGIFLQKALDQTTGSKLGDADGKHDGIMGSRTRGALKQAIADGKIAEVYSRMWQLRFEKFKVQPAEQQKAFGNGWLNNRMEYFRPPSPEG